MYYAGCFVFLLFQVSTEQSTGALRVRSKFPRFQEYYEVSFENDDLPADQTTKTSAKLYVGRYFTARGEFYEVGVPFD